MIDFAWFDIALLAAAAFGYVVRPERVRGVFHDPISGALLAGGLGAADVGAAAAAPVAAAALAPELAGGIGASIALPEVSVIAPAVGAGIGGEAVAGGAAAALGAGVGGAELAGSGIIGGSPSVVGSPTSTFGDQMQPGSLPEIGAAGAAPVTSAPITLPGAPGGGLGAQSFGAQAPMPATSATPLASATGGGVPAADATQVAAAPSGGVTDASGGADFAKAAEQPGVGTTNPATTAAKAAAPADMGSKIIDFAKKNPGLLLSAAPALLSMFGSPSKVPGQAELQNQQLQAQSMGKTLSAFQLSGTLPAGMQEIVNAKNAADKAAIRSNFAQLGYTGSTAERQALAQTDQATTAQIASIGAQLASQGLDWTHISQQELETLLNTQLKQQSDFSAAIGNLAKGLVPIGSAVDKAIAQ